jgi:DNA-binding transcriptional LysR family regulator
MERRQLEYFVSVAREGSLAAAAEAMHVSQPALSQAVRQLEKELGIELFHRLARGMRLSPAGEALLDPAKQVVRDFATAKASVDEVIGLKAGTLEIITMPGIVLDPLADWIYEFRQRAPHVRIRLRQTEKVEEIPKAVRSGDAELGFLQNPENCEDLAMRRVGEQTIVAVFPPGQDPGIDGPVTGRELLAAGMIIGAAGSGPEIVRREIQRSGFLQYPMIEVERRDSALSLVLAGAGAALLPRALAELAQAKGAVIRELDPPIRRDIHVIHRNGPPSPGARLFKQILADLNE